MKTKNILILVIILALSLNACQTTASAASQAVKAEITTQVSVYPTGLPAPTHPSPATRPAADTAAPTQAPTPTASLEPSNPNLQTVGPDPQNIPNGYNPLTGLPVPDPALLKLPAVLISITNFPPSARPQAGLSFSPWVYEIYIAEGMTRYLATFYGEFPKLPANTQTSPGAAQQTAGAQVGPVRSGRLPYVYIRDFFQNSCLVYASAAEQLRARLRGCAMVFGSDSNDINSAMLDVTRLQKIAEQNQRAYPQFNYSGNLFDASAQGKGLPARQIDVYYSLLNQARWQYDPTSGEYQKFDDYADGSGKFTPATDRLTGNQLAFSNVIVLYSEHTVLNPYIIDVKMGAGEKGKATIFRDGQKFEAYWSTVAGVYEKTTSLRRPLRFEDANGQPFALKPGQTWVHIATLPSEVQELSAGMWRLRFYAPAGAK
jgi:hypothetical protein